MSSAQEAPTSTTTKSTTNAADMNGSGATATTSASGTTTTGHSYQCSVCSEVGGPFSNRQLKRAMMGEPARCKKCIETTTAESKATPETEHEKEQAEPISAQSATDKAEIRNDEENSNIVSKEEEKRLKKEKKKAKKKNSAEDNAQFSDMETNEACFSDAEKAEENDGATKTHEKESVAQSSDAKDEKQSPQFSDTELEVANDKENKEDDSKEAEKDQVSIPRKRKSGHENSKSSSLIENVQPAKPKVAAAPEIMDVDEDDFRDSDQDGDDEDDEDNDPSMSLTDLKRKILGRNFQTYHDDDDNEGEEDRKPSAKSPHKYGASEPVTPALRSELSCSICHEPYLDPVSLLCGHNYCLECMQWWLQSSSSGQSKNCPTCRREVPPKDASSLGVNTALRACVVALLGDELEARLAAAREAERQATKGENGGAHDRGYEVLTTVDQDSWKDVCSWQSRRSTVLDAEDQRMQLAMGIWKDSTGTGIYYNSREQKMNVSLCLLTMEEDEVTDSGFPRVIHEDDDENDHLLASRHGGRFVHSFVQVMAKGAGRNIPLARRAVQATGVVDLSLKLSSEDMKNVHAISFRHEETGAVLELKVTPGMDLSNGASGERNRNRLDIHNGGRTAATAVEVNDDAEGEEAHFDSEDDGSHLDQYENDGFIADEADDGENEDDLCWTCRKGGDLMVCDGGDHVEGCGRSFHVECVNRDVVPPGDWICETCANDLALDVGVEGHEFPPEGEVVIDDSDDGEGNDDLIDSPSPQVNRKRKRIANQKGVVDIHDSSDSEPEFVQRSEEPSAETDKTNDDSPKNAQQHIADDSDDEDKDDNDKKPAARKPSKRVCVIDDSDDEE